MTGFQDLPSFAALIIYEIGDRVIYGRDALEATSISLDIGDKGIISKRVLKQGVWEFMVDFSTVNGIRRQWLYAHSLKKDPQEEDILLQLITAHKKALAEAQKKLGVLLRSNARLCHPPCREEPYTDPTPTAYEESLQSLREESYSNRAEGC